MKGIVLFLFFCHVASPAKHSLKFFITAGISNSPEFVAVGKVDEGEMGYCDSDSKTPEPKTTWMKKVLDDEPDQHEWYRVWCSQFKESPIGTIKENLKKIIGPLEGPLEMMTGCEWDDKTGTVRGFTQLDYNGEVIITFNLETEMWEHKKSMYNLMTQEFNKSDNDKKNAKWKFTLTNLCPMFLEKYVKAKQTSVKDDSTKTDKDNRDTPKNKANPTTAVKVSLAVIFIAAAVGFMY